MSSGLFGMGETVRVPASDSNEANQKTSEQQQASEKKSSVSDGVASPNTPSHNGSALSGRSTIPTALSKMATERRARRVRFYRNGDRFFKGMVYAVSTDRFRTFENLLKTLTSSPLCDKRVLPQGVRQIFTLDGAQTISSLDQLQEGQSYVCASSGIFRTLDYAKNEEPDWNNHVYPASSLITPTTLDHTTSRDSVSRQSTRASTSQSLHRPASQEKLDSSKSTMSTIEKKEYEDYQRSFVVPRLVTVIKHGKRPRLAVRLLLNKKTAQTFEQVMADISEAVKMDCGNVKKIYALSGKQVVCLADFFQEDLEFLACGLEKVGPEDLELNDTEVRQVLAYRPFAARSRERITLRRNSGSSQDTGLRKTQRSSSHHSEGSCKNSDRHSDAGEKSPTDTPKSQKDDTELSKLPLPELLSLKYEVGGLIGKGSFAEVLECKDKSTKRKYALKIINRKSCKGREQLLDNEVRILRRVKHQNIIRLIEDFSHQHRIYYIMELVKGGDLFEAISTSTKYTEQDAGGILYNLASALNYLHSLHIVHRDVKPENLLIRLHDDGTKSLKLGDFGLATEVHSHLYTVCGTPTYVAPEVIAETGYGVKIDVWSAGVLTYILLCGFPPFVSETDNQIELFDLIMTANFDFPSPHWNDVSSEAKNLIVRMLEIDPDARMSTKEVLDHNWVKNDILYEADLGRSVCSGLTAHFRRGNNRLPNRNAGVRIMASTALDKGSRFFQGRRSLQARVKAE